ncbi:MAG TPA: hypothetical protein VIG33_15835 [Pseudobdellovibrionaceae bacterium]|jgi:hypothetical protein
MKTSALRKNRRKNNGQVVVEYVLLLVIAVAIAALITKELVQRDPENPGILVEKWDSILKTIGEDLPDE